MFTTDLLLVHFQLVQLLLPHRLLQLIGGQCLQSKECDNHHHQYNIMNTHARTRTHTHTNTRMRTHTQTRMRAHTHTHTHTQTHTGTFNTPLLFQHLHLWPCAHVPVVL